MSYLDLSTVGVTKKPEAKKFIPSEQNLVVSNVTDRTTSKGGKAINITFEIVGGDYSTWKVSKSFNIVNDSEKAQQIGREQLKTFMHCAGMNTEKLENINDLMHQKVRAKVGTTTSQDGKQFLDIKYFISKDEVSPTSGGEVLF